MYYTAVGYRVCHEPSGRIFEGSGVVDTGLRHASKGKVHVTTGKHGILHKRMREQGLHHTNNFLQNADENATCRTTRIVSFWLEELIDCFLIRFSQNAYFRTRTCFIKLLPNQCPLRLLLEEFTVQLEIECQANRGRGQRRALDKGRLELHIVGDPKEAHHLRSREGL
jgi:hypothetical protein